MLIKITPNESRYEHGPRWRQRQPFGVKFWDFDIFAAIHLINFWFSSVYVN